MTKGKKIDNQTKINVITSYTLTNNYRQTAKETGVCPNTVKKIIENEKENNKVEYEKLCAEKKELFQDKANRIIDKSLELIEKRVDRATNNEKELDEIIRMVWQQDKEELNETQKRTIVNKISKMQLNSLSEITTALGTLYDKMRLAKGESTENSNFKVDINVVE